MLAVSWRAPGALNRWSRSTLPQRRLLWVRTHGPTCYTVSLSKWAKKRAAVAAVQASLKQFLGRWHSKPSRSPNAAVILASKNYASWLEDERFISDLLEPLRDTHLAQSNPQTLDVLCAVVDDVPSHQRDARFHGSFAVLHGRVDTLLPGLPRAGHKSPEEESTLLPSITLARAPLGLNPPTVDITVPLANTVFHNGRTHTMFTSWWQGDHKSRYRMHGRLDMTTQTITLPKMTGTMSQIHAQLGPITRPRKILAGLGNIVRQLEGDDPTHEPLPASKELEAIMPEILENLQKSGEAPLTGPVGVWALVIPEQYMKGGDLLAPFEKDWKVIHHIIASGGRLCKILSGGGGWGLKQGLLSLDPQVRYSSPDQEDVESFIKSFHGDTSANNGSVVRPGSYIQFFVEDPWTPAKAPPIARPFVCIPYPKVMIRSQKEAETEVAVTRGDRAEIAVTANLFGAVSNQGFYLASTPDSGSDHPTVCTKIDSTETAIVTAKID